MVPKWDFHLKNRVIIIGGLHGVALLYGLFQAVFNIIEEQRAVTDGDIFYIVLHLSFHVFLISTLVVGAITDNTLLILPWLIVSFPVFASVSYYTLKYSSSTYPSQFVFNISFICLGWYLWFTVYRFWHKCKHKNSRIEKT